MKRATWCFEYTHRRIFAPPATCCLPRCTPVVDVVYRMNTHVFFMVGFSLQAVKPAKDLKTFLGNSLGRNGPFPPSCNGLDSGWEVSHMGASRSPRRPAG